MKKILILLIAICTMGVTFAQSNHKCNDNDVTPCSGSVKDATINIGGSYTPSGIDVGESKCDHSGCGGNVKKHKVTYSSRRTGGPTRSSGFSFASRSGGGGVNIDTSKPGTYEVTATCSEGCTGLGSGTVTVKAKKCPKCEKIDKQIKEKIKEIKEHQKKLKKEAQELTGTDAALKSLKKNLEKQDKELEEAVKKNEKALRAKKVAEKSKTQWEKDIVANNKEIKKLEMEIRKIKADSTPLTWIFDKMTISAKNSEILVLKTENTLKDSKIVQAVADLATATAELLQLDKILPGLRKVVAELKASVSETEKAFQELKDSVKKLEKDGEFLQLELEDLNLQKEECIKSH